MPRSARDVAEAELALERLFRLTAGRGLQRAQRDEIGIDVNRVGYAVLRCLDHHGPSHLGDVAAECAVDAGTASRQVKALEVAGLIARGHLPDDGRYVVLSLTADGKATHDRIVAFRRRYLARALRDWDHDDVATLTGIVERLVEALQSTSLS